MHHFSLAFFRTWDCDRFSDKLYGGDLFPFSFDPDVVSRTSGITIFNSTDDDEYIHESVQEIRRHVDPVTYREFTDYGHFCISDLGTAEFPELLEAILER